MLTNLCIFWEKKCNIITILQFSDNSRLMLMLSLMTNGCNNSLFNLYINLQATV